MYLSDVIRWEVHRSVNRKVLESRSMHVERCRQIDPVARRELESVETGGGSAAQGSRRDEKGGELKFGEWARQGRNQIDPAMGDDQRTAVDTTLNGAGAHPQSEKVGTSAEAVLPLRYL